MKDLKYVDWRYYSIFVLLFVLIVFLIWFVTNVNFLPTKAAPVQQYTYGVYTYTPPTASERGISRWFESDDSEQKTLQGMIDTAETPSLIQVFNFVGTLGWHFVSADRQGVITLYIFERPSDA